MSKPWRTLLICAALLPGMAAATAQNTVTVNASSVLREFETNPVGINLNYLLDKQNNRPAGSRSLGAAFKEMNSGLLRFPGGEKSDSYLWAQGPTWLPSTHTLARSGPGVWPENQNWPSYDTRYFQNGSLKDTCMNFDEFMQVAQEAGSEPLIVVCLAPIYKPAQPGEFVATRAQLLQTAVEWVRYANITKGYNIKYWAIGNESDMSGSEMNGRTPDAATYAADLIEFSNAMKAVDPTIKIGANASTQANYTTILNAAYAQLDFLVAHNYPVWQWTTGYNRFRDNAINFMAEVNKAVNALNGASIPVADKARIRIKVTETGLIDWSYSAGTGGWAHSNDTGRALVLFDLIGQHLKQPKLDAVQFWNTRWVDPDPVFAALKNNNQLEPQGRALAIWGQHLRSQLVSATSNHSKILSYASREPKTGMLTIFVLNKDTSALTTTVTLQNFSAGAPVLAYVFKGASATDTNPSWAAVPSPSIINQQINLSLPALSITVLDIPAPAATGEVILDNNSTSGVTFTGTWPTSTHTAGYYGANYAHDDNTGKGTKSVRYTPTLAAGAYQVALRYVSGTGRASNVPVDIQFAGGTDQATVDQRTGGGQWVTLGTYQFASGTAGNVLISNTGTSGHVIADAVKFTPVTAPAEIIVDNTDASGVEITGTWTASTWTGGGFYTGTNYLHDGNAGKGTKSVRWRPTLPVTGSHQVYVKYSSSADRASNVPVDINHAGGTQTLSLDQRTGGGQWRLLGTWNFNAGTTGNVLIRNAGTTASVAADSVRFVRQ